MKTQNIIPPSSTRRMALALCATALAGVFLAAKPASAQTVIYSDDFTHAAGDLNGNTVQTSTGLFGGTLGATWLSPNGTNSGTPVFNYSGTGDVSISTDFANTYYAFLPLTLQTGVVYTLQVDIAPTTLAASSSFLGIGFAANTVTANPASSGHSPWVRYFRDGEIQINNGGTLIEQVQGEQGGAVPIRATLTLDTTGALYETTWSILDLSDMSNIGTGSFTYSTNPTVVSVFMNVGNSPGTFDNFSLTAVPEPSSFALLGVGLLALGCRARSRRKRC